MYLTFSEDNVEGDKDDDDDDYHDIDDWDENDDGIHVGDAG